MTHEMKLQPSPYAAILEGRKTVEMRLYDERRRGISVGDEIVFTNNETGEKMSVLVTSVKVYPSFAELYLDYDKEAIGYMPDEVADPRDMEEYYPREKQALYGAVAIGIERIHK